MDSVKRYLNVLFHFERQSTRTQTRESKSESSEMDMSPLFIRDIRGWIIYLASALLLNHDHDSNRFLLLHALRSPGISLWGINLIQFTGHSSAIERSSDTWWDEYITGLNALLSPIEELKEKVENLELENKRLNERLKVLENEEWVVVEEGMQKNRHITSITLSEDDYIAILDQFDIPTSYYQRISVNTLRLKAENGVLDMIWLSRVFADAIKLISILQKGIEYFSTFEYGTFIRELAQLITRIVKETSMTVLNSTITTNLHYKSIIIGDFISNVTIEIDNLIMQVVTFLIENQSYNLTSFLTSLPLCYVSTTSKCRLAIYLLLGIKDPNDCFKKFSELERNIGVLSKAAISSGIFSWISSLGPAAIYVIDFLAQIATSQTANIHPEEEETEEIEVNLIRLIVEGIFTMCFLNIDFRENLYKSGRNSLSLIAQKYSFILSDILYLISEHTQSLGKMSLYIFRALPIIDWPITETDIKSLLFQLKDGESYKMEFAQYLLDHLDWNFKDTLTHLGSKKNHNIIPRKIHRFLAVEIVSLVLDITNTMEVKSTSSILSTPVAMATTALSSMASVGSSVIPNPMKSIPVNRDTRFEDWCWTILMKLSLYDPQFQEYQGDHYSDGHHNFYQTNPEMDENSPFSKSYIPFDSKELLSLKAFMSQNAMAAYVMLLISDIGYDYNVFQYHGWDLLKVIQKENKFISCIRACNEILPKFVPLNVITHREFNLFFSNFFKKQYSVVPPIRTIKTENNDNETLNESWCLLFSSFVKRMTLSKSSATLKYVENGFKYLIAAIFANPQWKFDTSSIRILDMICEICLAYDFIGLFRNALVEEYRKMLKDYQKLSQNLLSGTLVENAIGITYSFVSSSVNGSHAYPTLLQVSDPSSILSNMSSFIYGNSEVECEWYSFEALLAETELEAEIRGYIGHIMAEESHPCLTIAHSMLSKSRTDSIKPLSQFVIYRWALCCLKIDVDHCLTPLFWQMFFILYFEKCSSSNVVATINPFRFGFHFLKDREDLLSKLKLKLMQLIKHAQSKNESMSQSNSSNKDQKNVWNSLLMIYNAMMLWINDTKITMAEFSIENIPEPYLSDRLRNCLSSQLPSSNHELLWYDLVDLNSILHNLHEMTMANTKQLSSSLFQLVEKSELSEAQKKSPEARAQPSPPFVQRNPLINLNTDETMEKIQDKVANDLQIILTGSAIHQKRLDAHLDCDRDYLNALSSLYVNEELKGHTSRFCKTPVKSATRLEICARPANFEYVHTEAHLLTDIRNILAENRVRAEEFTSFGEEVGSPICVSGLRLLRCIEWLTDESSTNKPVARNLEIQELGKVIFYQLLEMANRYDVMKFGPARYILQVTIQRLGSRFISTSEEDMSKLFKICFENDDSGDSVKIRHYNWMASFISPFFNPAICLNDFVSMYEKVASITFHLDAPIGLSILERFNVKQWIQNSIDRIYPDPNINSINHNLCCKDECHQLVVCIIKKLEKCGNPFKEEYEGISRQHRILFFHTLIYGPSLFNLAFSNLLDSALNNKIEQICFDVFIKAITASKCHFKSDETIGPSRKSSNSSINLTETMISSDNDKEITLDKFEIVSLLNTLSTKLLDTNFVNSTNKASSSSSPSTKFRDLFSILHPYLQPLTKVLQLLFKSQNLFYETVDLKMVWNLLEKCFIPWIGCISGTKGNGNALVPWSWKRSAEASQFVKSYREIVQQVANVCKEDETQWLWDLYIVAVQAKPPSSALEVLHQEWWLSSPLKNFNIEKKALHDLLILRKGDLLSIDVLRCSSQVIEQSKWGPRGLWYAAKETSIELLDLIFTYIAKSEMIFPDVDRRRRFFSNILINLLSIDGWQEFPSHSFHYLINTLPCLWSSNLAAESTSITYDTFTNPLSFCLYALKVIASIKPAPIKSIHDLESIFKSSSSNPVIIEDESFYQPFPASMVSMTISKALIFVDYVINLLQTQIQLETTQTKSNASLKLPIAAEKRNFDVAFLDAVVVEQMRIIDYLENMNGLRSHINQEHDINSSSSLETQPSFLRSRRHLLRVLNDCLNGKLSQESVFRGILIAGWTSSKPLTFLNAACVTLASADRMALTVEVCIERTFQLSRDTADWNKISTSLIIPELEEETFIKSCLEKGLGLSLFAHALQRLMGPGNQSQYDFRCLVGTQVGVWITRIQLIDLMQELHLDPYLGSRRNFDSTTKELLKDALETPQGRENKVIPIIALYFNILAEEFNSKLSLNFQRKEGDNKNRTMLISCLPSICKILLTWAADRGEAGFLAKLGFGRVSIYSPEFRLFCRIVGSFAQLCLLKLKSDDLYLKTPLLSSSPSSVLLSPSSSSTNIPTTLPVSSQLETMDLNTVEAYLLSLPQSGIGYERLSRQIETALTFFRSDLSLVVLPKLIDILTLQLFPGEFYLRPFFGTD